LSLVSGQAETPLVAKTAPIKTASGDELRNRADDHGDERQRSSKQREHVLGLRTGECQCITRGYVLQLEADEQIVRAVETLARHHACSSDHVSESVLDNVVEHTASVSQTHVLTVRQREVPFVIPSQHNSVGSLNG